MKGKGIPFPSWFPLHQDMVESADFVGLSATKKLCWLTLLDRFNEHGPFYLSDLELGITAGCSLFAARQARRRFEKLKWITTKHGFKAPGRQGGVATRYESVQWATTGTGADGAANRFAPMHRHAFRVLLSYVRGKWFSPKDVVVYIALVFWRHTHDNDDQDDFFITKRELREFTGLADAPERVRTLHDRFKFSTGDHLFEFRDGYQRLTISKWATFADPSDDETNRKRAEALAQDIRDGVRQARKPKGRKPKRKAKR